MKMFRLLILFASIFTFTAHAEDGLVIHAGEIGVGKFHRYDHSVHPYADNNAWKPYVLTVSEAGRTPYVRQNKDFSYTVIFSTLDELITSIEKLVRLKNQRVRVLNINGHGLPGHMWFPKDAKTQDSSECLQWKKSAEGSDVDNYTQYYSPITKKEIMDIRTLSNRATRGFGYPCVTGLKSWEEIVARHTKFKNNFAPNVQIHFLSCVVGLGKLGEDFTKGIAALLLSHQEGRVQTSLMYGLGDWSMPEGMGFWDYQNDEQINRDNARYPVERADRPQAQRGTIRFAGILDGVITANLMQSMYFMFVDGRMPGVLKRNSLSYESEVITMASDLPKAVHIPGTKQIIPVVLYKK